MNGIRRALSVIALGGASVGAWFGASSLVRDVQFARATQQVELNRQELQNVQDLSGAYRKVGKVVEPSVVQIEVRKAADRRQAHIPDDLLRRFYPDRDGDGSPDVPEDFDQRFHGGGGEVRGEGSGVIMQVNGDTAYILTNNHVAGGASEIRVTLHDGREIDDAKLVGADPKSDLAVVKIKADRLIAAQWGDSQYLEKGEIILAFGSPFGYVGSMTHGIVSALNRQARVIEGQFAYEDFIQVDAPINPGNSGGPLVNLRGEVVGINTAIATRTGAFNGIGLAIPSAMAKPVFEQIRDSGKVVRGWLGVEIGDLNQSTMREIARASGFEGEKGVLVTKVVPDAPATGKLEAGDVITSINGKDVATMNQLRSMIAGVSPNTDVKLKVVRKGKPTDVSIRVEEQPTDLLSRARGDRQGNPGDSAPNDDGSLTTASLGMRLATPTENQLSRFGLEAGQEGALVTAIGQNSVAQQFGISAGDLIVKIGNTSVTSADSADQALAGHDLKKGVLFTVRSKDGERLVFVKAAKR